MARAPVHCLDDWRGLPARQTRTEGRGQRDKTGRRRGSQRYAQTPQEWRETNGRKGVPTKETNDWIDEAINQEPAIKGLKRKGGKDWGDYVKQALKRGRGKSRG